MMIEIDDEIWSLFRSSMAVFGWKTDDECIRALEQQLWEESKHCLEDAERELISSEPEALVRRMIGLEKEACCRG